MAEYRVDPNDPVPRYYQAYASLKERIRSGEFAPGDALPSERQLVHDYGVSRITIVKALDLLVRDGLIERQHGRGNFVLDRSQTSLSAQEGTIAICISAFLEPYTSSVLIGAIQVAARKRFQIQIAGTTWSRANSSEQEAQYIRAACDKEVDGVLLYPRTAHPDEALYRELEEGHYPLVLVDRHFPNLDIDHVVFDDEDAGYKLTEILIAQGHERIAIVPAHEVSVSSVRGRLRGYQRALEAHGLQYDEERVWLDVYEELDLSPEWFDKSQSTYTRLQERIERSKPTALVAINSYVAEQVNVDLMKIRAERMQAVIAGSVPETGYDLDIAVAAVGYKYPTHDQTSLVALAMQPGELLGERAMELLIGRISGTVTGPSQAVTMPMEIVQL